MAVAPLHRERGRLAGSPAARATGAGDEPMYDPLELAAETARAVVRGRERKYYRFRGARFYGGIATADCLGCCLRCAFCWAWKRVIDPAAAGRFHRPEEVASRIAAIAETKGFRQARLSGNEPTLGRDHLVGVLGALPTGLEFVLETNGILLGHDPSYAKELRGARDLHVRVSIKGCAPGEFSRLTGAEAEAYALPLRALENLLAAGVACHPAVMVSFSSAAAIEGLRQSLAAIDPAFEAFEEEELFSNPAIERRLRALERDGRH